MRKSSVTLFRNGYRIHFDKQCYVWQVQKKDNGKWVPIEEFVEQRKAIQWAENK